MEALAACPNVTAKIGGFAVGLQLPSYLADPPPTVEQMAAVWRPYIDVAIELFGPERCMFESNFPVDAGGCSYADLWNVFKYVTAGHSAQERRALFAGTAERVYRLDAELARAQGPHRVRPDATRSSPTSMAHGVAVTRFNVPISAHCLSLACR